MDFLTRLSLKRPVSTLLVLLVLIVFGISSVFSFEMELEPQMTFPMIAIRVSYPGADPETVDKLVVTPIEELGLKLTGMMDNFSEIYTGECLTVLQFDYDTKMDEAFMDLKSEMERLNLPDGCEKPIVIRGQNTNPFMNFQVTSKSNRDVLSFVKNTVKPSIERQNGVAEVKVVGGREEYIRVLLNERLMDQYSVTVDSIKQALAATEYNVPADSMRQGSMDIKLSSTSKITSISGVESVPIRTDNGVIITLRDVADVSYAIRKADSISRHNGKEDIRVTVTKNQIASTVTAANQVVAELNRIEAENEDISINITMNSADSIITSLKEVGFTLIIGILLSMLTLFLFFGDIKASLIVGSSMPISLLATLILMAFAKLQLNIMTMGGLVIAIGMMVDGSIVVLESCFRAQERGLDFRDSALEGTKEVTASIVASTITTVVVYAPIAVMGGLFSQMFSGLCVTIIFSMLTSLVVSLTFIPLFFVFYKPVEKKNAHTVLLMQKISARYGRMIRKIIPRRITVLLVTFVMVGLTVLMAMNMHVDMESEADMGEFEVTVTNRKGIAMEVTDENSKQFETALIEDPDIENVDYSVEGNVATINAFIRKDCGKTTAQKVDEYNSLWSKETTADIVVKSVSSGSSSDGAGAKVTLTGVDFEELKKNVYTAMEKLKTIDGVFNVTSKLDSGATEARIHIDPKKTMDAGLTPQGVATMIANANKGIEALKIKSKGEEYKVRLEYPEGQFDDLYKIMSLKLKGSGNRIVTLSDIATLEYEEAPEMISKRKGIYSLEIDIFTSEDDKYRVQDEADEMISKMDLGSSSSGMDFLTEFENNEVKKLLVAVAAAVFLVFAVMAMQFESPRFSTMVMMSIPFSFIGSIVLMFITDSTLTSSALLGTLMLVGIVVNDGILFVDTANGFKSEYPIEEALARSGEIRIRPILMTTLTTVLSMVPLILSKDSGASIMDGMGLIIIGGLMASTLLILILLPTFYILIMGKKARLENLRKFPPYGKTAEEVAPSKREARRKKREKLANKELEVVTLEENTSEDKAVKADQLEPQPPEEE